MPHLFSHSGILPDKVRVLDVLGNSTPQPARWV
jgi:hypothetical protein